MYKEWPRPTVTEFLNTPATFSESGARGPTTNWAKLAINMFETYPNLAISGGFGYPSEIQISNDIQQIHAASDTRCQ